MVHGLRECIDKGQAGLAARPLNSKYQTMPYAQHATDRGRVGWWPGCANSAAGTSAGTTHRGLTIHEEAPDSQLQAVISVTSTWERQLYCACCEGRKVCKGGYGRGHWGRSALPGAAINRVADSNRWTPGMRERLESDISASSPLVPDI